MVKRRSGLPARGVVLVVADVVYVAVHQRPPGRRAAGTAGSGPVPGSGDDLPFCGQHKTNTTPGSGKDQHGNNTDKTVLPGTRRHACYNDRVSPWKPSCRSNGLTTSQASVIPGYDRPSVNRQVIGSSPIAGASK